MRKLFDGAAAPSVGFSIKFIYINTLISSILFYFIEFAPSSEPHFTHFNFGRVVYPPVLQPHGPTVWKGDLQTYHCGLSQ